MAPERFAFIVRIWIDHEQPGGDGALLLRGSIQLADSQRLVYFAALDELPQLMARLTALDSSLVDAPDA